MRDINDYLSTSYNQTDDYKKPFKTQKHKGSGAEVNPESFLSNFRGSLHLGFRFSTACGPKSES